MQGQVSTKARQQAGVIRTITRGPYIRGDFLSNNDELVGRGGNTGHDMKTRLENDTNFAGLGWEK